MADDLRCLETGHIPERDKPRHRDTGRASEGDSPASVYLGNPPRDERPFGSYLHGRVAKRHHCAVPFCGNLIVDAFTFCTYHGNLLPQSFHVQLHRIERDDKNHGSLTSARYREWLARCVLVIRRRSGKREEQGELPGLGA